MTTHTIYNYLMKFHSNMTDVVISLIFEKCCSLCHLQCQDSCYVNCLSVRPSVCLSVCLSVHLKFVFPRSILRAVLQLQVQTQKPNLKFDVNKLPSWEYKCFRMLVGMRSWQKIAMLWVGVGKYCIDKYYDALPCIKYFIFNICISWFEFPFILNTSIKFVDYSITYRHTCL